MTTSSGQGNGKSGRKEPNYSSSNPPRPPSVRVNKSAFVPREVWVQGIRLGFADTPEKLADLIQQGKEYDYR
jgi:hypothetical protein